MASATKYTSEFTYCCHNEQRVQKHRTTKFPQLVHTLNKFSLHIAHLAHTSILALEDCGRKMQTIRIYSFSGLSSDKPLK